MKIIEGKFGSKMASDIADKLRELADAIDRGEVTGFAAAYETEGTYSVLKPSSPQTTLVLSTLLHDSTVRDFYQ